MAQSSSGITLPLLFNGKTDGTLFVPDTKLFTVGAKAIVTGTNPSGQSQSLVVLIDSIPSRTRLVVHAITTGSKDMSTFKADRNNGDNTGYSATIQQVAGQNLTNQFTGTAVLSGGTVTVTSALVTSTSVVLLNRQAAGGTLGDLSVGTITAGTSFVINSSSGTDTSTVYWELVL